MYRLVPVMFKLPPGKRHRNRVYTKESALTTVFAILLVSKYKKYILVWFHLTLRANRVCLIIEKFNRKNFINNIIFSKENIESKSHLVTIWTQKMHAEKLKNAIYKRCKNKQINKINTKNILCVVKPLWNNIFHKKNAYFSNSV